MIVFETSRCQLTVNSTKRIYKRSGDNELVTVDIQFFTADNSGPPNHPVILIEEFLIDAEMGLTIGRLVAVNIRN